MGQWLVKGHRRVTVKDFASVEVTADSEEAAIALVEKMVEDAEEVGASIEYIDGMETEFGNISSADDFDWRAVSLDMDPVALRLFMDLQLKAGCLLKLSDSEMAWLRTMVHEWPQPYLGRHLEGDQDYLRVGRALQSQQSELVRLSDVEREMKWRNLIEHREALVPPVIMEKTNDR